MEKTQAFSKIYVSLYRSLSQSVIEALKEIGVVSVNIEAGRSLQLEHATGLTKLLSSAQPIDEEPVSTFAFLVRPQQERPVIDWLVGKLGLDLPGRGSIYAKSITLVGANEAWRENLVRVPQATSRVVSTHLTGIACVVQKGEANPVARIGLSTGSAIPIVSYGIGTGLRNRLGSWRILIPAEKEITTLVMDADEAEAVMDMMIDTGSLDQPGKGFIYLFPVNTGVLDTKFHVGSMAQAASIEQIITAIDDMKGTTEWRRKSLVKSSDSTKKRKYLTGLVDFSLICNEGYCEQLTKIAMAAGAAGATYRRLKYLSLDDQVSAISPAREISVMTIGEAQVEAITKALVDAGVYGPDYCGEIHLNPVPKACTFLGK